MVLAVVALLATLVAATMAAPPAGAADVLGTGGDLLRTGWYPSPTSPSPGLVAGGTFGQQLRLQLDGQIYAQPVASQGTVLAVTENNNAYGIDSTSGAITWQRNVGVPWKGADLSCNDLAPNVGITATPVIDPATNVAYFTNKTYASGTSGPGRWLLHAVSMSSGAEQPDFPVEIQGVASNDPAVTFNPTTQMQRPALLLMGGVIYTAFGGHCDAPPFRGWVIGISTAGAMTTRWALEAGQAGSPAAGVWQSGGGIVSDGAGQLIITTGNGLVPAAAVAGRASTPQDLLGQAVVRLTVQPDLSLRATDFFIPYNGASLNDYDGDLGSGAPVGLPDTFGTPTYPHLMVQTGKEGYVYLLDRDNLGGFKQGASGGDAVVSRVGPHGGVWGKPGVWPGDGGWIYDVSVSGGGVEAGGTGFLHAYRSVLDGQGKPTLSLVSTSTDTFGFGSGSPVITSEATTSGSALVWVVWSPNGSGFNSQLRAYDAVPVNGTMNMRWSAPIGQAAKFTVPTPLDRKMWLGTRDGVLLAFGSPAPQPLSGAAVAFPTTTVGAATVATATFTAQYATTINGLSITPKVFAAGTPSKALPASLVAGESLSVPVTFTPTVGGNVAGTLTATALGGNASIGLSGTGQTQAAQLITTPPFVSFGGVTTGGAGSASSITISNTGGQPATISALTAPAAPFITTGAPAVGTVVQPGQSIAIGISFVPTVDGSFYDAISLTSSAGTLQVPLTGSAAGPGRMVATPSSIDLGSVYVGATASASFELANTGASPLTILKSKPPIGNGFSVDVDIPEGSGLAVGASRTGSVHLRPTVAGPVTGSWVLNADDGVGIRYVNFTAQVLTAPPIDALGSSTWQRNGTAVANGGAAVDLTPAAGSYQAGSTFWPYAVPTSSMDIRFNLTITDTTSPGGDGAALVFGDPNAGATPTSLGSNGGGLGYAGIAGPAIGFDTYQNAGDPCPNFVGVADHGIGSRVYYPYNACQAPQFRNATRAIHVTERSGRLRIEVDGIAMIDVAQPLPPQALLGFTASDGDQISKQAISDLTVGLPKVVASQGAIDFGTTALGSTQPGAITLSNTGGSLATVTSVVAPGAGFSASLPAVGATIEAGASLLVPVTFAPTASGVAASSLSVVTDGGTATVALSGAGARAGNLVVTQSVDLGVANINTSRLATITLSNTGELPVTVDAPIAPAAPFSLIDPIAAGTVLNGGASMLQTVKFAPTDWAPSTSTVGFTASDGAGVRATTVVGDGANPDGQSLQLAGSASVIAGGVQLTPPTFAAAGSAFLPSTYSSTELALSFNARLDTIGADGMTVALTDAAAPPLLGPSGGAMGWIGNTGYAVMLDTWQNAGEPSNSFVGLAKGGVDDRPNYLSTVNVPGLGGASHDVTLRVKNSHMTVDVDKVRRIDADVVLPPTVRVGFTGATGGVVNTHQVTGIALAARRPIDAPGSATWTLNGSATSSAPGAVELTTAAPTFTAGSTYSGAPAPARGLRTAFDLSIGGGDGADGMTFSLADVAQPATQLGLPGGGLGWSGTTGLAVTFDTYKNDLDPTAGFVGIATGATGADFTYAATAPFNLRNGVHRVVITTTATSIAVDIDGIRVVQAAVAVPLVARPGFTAATGGLTDRHAISAATLSVV